MSPDVLAPPAPERVSQGSVLDELEDRPRLLPSPRTPPPRRWGLAAIVCVALVVVIAMSTLRLRDGPITLGFGGKTTGGAGGAVLRVTSLADGGPGSLRAAVTTATPAAIVFEVSGTITLSQPIAVASNKTIDGGGQITLNRAPGWLGRGGL